MHLEGNKPQNPVLINYPNTMVKTETDMSFRGIGYKVIEYKPGKNPQEDLEEFLEDDKRIQQEMGVKTRRFENRTGRPEPILETYGPSEVILSYLCDDYISSWQGAKIIRAPVKYGREATTLIEHILNTQGKMLGTPFQRYQPLAEINFDLEESTKGRRTLNLITGANHPQLMWREMYNIFVAENPSTTEKPTRWYDRFFRK